MNHPADSVRLILENVHIHCDREVYDEVIRKLNEPQCSECGTFRNLNDVFKDLVLENLHVVGASYTVTTDRQHRTGPVEMAVTAMHAMAKLVWRGKAPERREPYICKHPGVCGGRACLVGRRVPVWQIAQYARMGTPIQGIREMFSPNIDNWDVAEALAYAQRHPDEIQKDIDDQETD